MKINYGSSTYWTLEAIGVLIVLFSQAGGAFAMVQDVKNDFRNTANFAIKLNDIDNNDISNVLSNPDYIKDYHRPAYRRIKKILIQPRELSNVDYFLQPFSIRRRKRSAYINSLEQILPSPVYETKNITAIELKYFQNILISTLQSVCPELGEKHLIMLKAVENSAQDEIDSASASFSNLLSFTLTKDKILISIMKKIHECTTEAIKKKAKRESKEKVKQLHSESQKSRYGKFRQQLQEEAKQYELLTQKDVVPTQENIAKLFEFIQVPLFHTCFDEIILREAAENIGKSLTLTIRSNKLKNVGKRATSHQNEMEKLLDETNKCMNEIFLLTYYT